VDDAAGLTEIAVRATKHDGYDDGAVSRFMPGLKINLALIAAGLVHVAEGEQGVLGGYVSFRPREWGPILSKAFSSIQPIRGAVLAHAFSLLQSSIREKWREM
jgi:hypothetical protein